MNTFDFLNQSLMNAPLWAVAVTFAVTYAATKTVLNLHYSMLLVWKFLKWLYRVFIKPRKTVSTVSNEPAPVKEYFVGSKGELYPVYK